MDQGIWATWYDVDQAERDRHLAWTRGIYVPWLQQVSGHAWVALYGSDSGGPMMKQVKDTIVTHTDEAIGQGSQYLLLVGAPSAHTFFRRGFDPALMPTGFEAMLALRKESRTVVFTEETRVTGPAYATSTPGGAPAPAIQMGTLRVRSIEDEFELLRWYAQFRLPEMARTTGCVQTRKLSGVAGWAKHGILYEFESLEMRLRHFEEPQEARALDPGHWTSRITRSTIHAPGSPFIGSRIWPPANVG